jgi:hypothetical protein
MHQQNDTTPYVDCLMFDDYFDKGLRLMMGRGKPGGGRKVQGEGRRTEQI